MLCQLGTNGVVPGADGDILGAVNSALIAAAKATLIMRMKAEILMDGENGQKYKHIKDNLEKKFSKVTDNYPTTVERAVYLLNTYKIKFE